ncbi:MAG: hypothetical protein M1840_001547 [Geoglossum simile]|nr:MAG: hypothetical protein M1840_001547 [Geoglossum simile]
MSYSRVGLVTGANKGIGLATVRNLALQYPASAFNNGPLLIYLTSRDKSRGEEALESISNDAQLKKAKALVADGGLVDVRHHALDIAKATTIQSFADFLQKEHPQGIDFVVNNAGIAMSGFGPDTVNGTLQTNYYGTLHATQAFLPLIKPHGRLVNVSSMLGTLNRYGPQLRNRFLSATSAADITALMDEFRAAVEAGTELTHGWPRNAYAVSKAGVVGLTRVFARTNTPVLVNACCPGYVDTDMTGGHGVKTPDEGAQTLVLLALGDIGGRSGLFWQNERPIEW